MPSESRTRDQTAGVRHQKSLVRLAEAARAQVTALPATAGPPERDDDEDARPGPAPRCLCPEPRRGVRLVSVREPKTAVDGAPEVRQRLDQPSPEADRSRLVWAHLTTQGIGARDEAFPPIAS